MPAFMRSLFLTAFISLLSLSACQQSSRSDQSQDTPAQKSGTSTSTDNGGISEGTINGGGGQGRLCRVGRNETLEILDLFEARSAGLTLLPQPKSEKEAFELALDLMVKHFWNPITVPKDQFKEILRTTIKKEWLDKIRYIEDGKKLRRMDDTGTLIKDENCESVQIAIFHEDSLLMDKKLWMQLDYLNRAALWVHEMIYFLEREHGETNSISTRRLVGQMFSTAGARPRAEGVPTDLSKYVTCRIFDNDQDAGYAFVFESQQRQEPGVEFVFTYLKGSNHATRTSLFMPHANIQEILSPKVGSILQSPLSVDLVAAKLDVQLFMAAEKSRFVVLDKQNNKKDDLKIECEGPRFTSTDSTTPPPKAVSLPPVPQEIELKSRYEGHGDYATTATYSFAKMTHEAQKTNNKWDILFEARSDMAKDYFQADLVGGDNSFLFPLHTTGESCEKVDPCEIKNAFIKSKQTADAKGPKAAYADVLKNQCYLLISQNNTAPLAVLFRVKDHQKSISVTLDQIKTLSSTDPNMTDCKQ